MVVETETEAIRERVALLESHGGTEGQWRQLDARVFAAILEAQVQLVTMQRSMIERIKEGKQDWSWLRSRTPVHELVELLDELRTMRATVQSKIVEQERSLANED